MKYEGQLPENINAHLRNPLIRQYQQWKGINYVPTKTDASLRWSNKDPFSMIPVTDSPWQLISKGTKKATAELKTSTFLPAQGSQLVVTSKKHKLDNLECSPVKKLKSLNISDIHPMSHMPLGLKWNGPSWSCAYDSLFVILYDIWVQHSNIWTAIFKDIGNEYLNDLTDGFDQVLKGESSFEDVRDRVKHKLHNAFSNKFPLGQVGTSVNDLAIEIFRTVEPVASSQLVCSQCNHEGMQLDDLLGYVLHASRSSNIHSTSNWLTVLNRRTQANCPECLSGMTQPIQYNSLPKILIFEYPDCNIRTSHMVQCTTGGQTVTLYLRGIVYHGEHHFTSRIITQEGNIWYHDGIGTGKICQNDGTLNATSDAQLKQCRNRSLVLAIYAQQ